MSAVMRRLLNDDGSSEGSWTWFIGVTIYLLGTTSMALGANLQRYSMTKEAKKPEDEQRKKMKQPFVVVGFILMVCSGIFLSVALIFASQTQLAPLILFIFLSNALFAHFLNKEPFYPYSDGFATFLVCAGVLMCVVSAPHNNKYYDNDEMKELMQQPSFIIFAVCAAVAIGYTWIWKIYTMKRCERDITRLPPRIFMMLQLAFGSLPGMFGGVNITLTKSTFSLIIGQVEDHGFVGIWISPLLYALGFTVACTYVMQMKSTVDGLELCSAMIVISTQAVSEMVTATMGGLLYFQDYKHFEVWSALVFSAGIILSLAGVAVLAYNRSFDVEEEGEDEGKCNDEMELHENELHATDQVEPGDVDVEMTESTPQQDFVVSPDGPDGGAIIDTLDSPTGSMGQVMHDAEVTLEADQVSHTVDGGAENIEGAVRTESGTRVMDV